MTITQLIAEAQALCDADSTSYPAVTSGAEDVLLRRINAAYEEEVGKLIAQNGKWQFDDTNYTDLPVGYATLVNGQEEYTFASAHIEIRRVQVMDSNGIWHLLNPIDLDSLDIPREEYQKTAGMPYEYDVEGNSLTLKPAPSSGSVTLMNGLRVYFQRTASTFSVSDVTTGTKTPGFSSPYHILLAYKAALPYCMSYKKDRVALYLNEINRLERGLLNFETNKQKDVRKRLSMGGVNPR